MFRCNKCVVWHSECFSVLCCIVLIYCVDLNLTEVSRMTGWSYRTIYRYLQEADQPLPPKKPARTIDMAKVKQAHELYAVYGKKTEVARLMKMSRWQIDKYLCI